MRRVLEDDLDMFSQPCQRAARACIRSVPASIAWPPMRAPSIRRSSALPVVVLPQPDSPSKASVSRRTQAEAQPVDGLDPGFDPAQGAFCGTA